MSIWVTEAISWIIFGLPVLIAEGIILLYAEYYWFKPKSNDTMVSQLEKLAKAMAKMDGWKKEAKQLKKLALEVKKEGTPDVTPTT